MASRMLSWLVLGLCLITPGLAAPIAQEPSLALGSLLAERSASSPPSAPVRTWRKKFPTKLSDLRLSRVYPHRTSSSSSSRPWPRDAGSSVASSYFLDSTLGRSEPSVSVAIVPVPSGPRRGKAGAGHAKSKSKSDSHSHSHAGAGASAELLTVTYGGHKVLPVWARPWTSEGFRGALRFSQGLAIFILATSLGMALVCSYWRSRLPRHEHFDWLDLEHADMALVSKDEEAHHVQDGSYMLEQEQDQEQEQEQEQEPAK